MGNKSFHQKALGTNEIAITKTPPIGGVFVMPAFSFGHTLAERGFRPQAHHYGSKVWVKNQ
jgi:hypothetical protein